jgi:Anti-sigma-K factor rskA
MLDLDTQDLIFLYALDALELVDRERVEKLLLHDLDAQQELKANLELTELLASRVPVQKAPDQLELKVLAKIQSLQPTPQASVKIISETPVRVATRVVIPWFARASLGFALAASLAAAWFGFQNRQLSSNLKALQDQQTTLSNIVADSRARNLQLTSELKALQDQKTTLSSIVADNRARVVALLAPDGKTVVGQAIITRDGRVLMAHNMGKLPPGKTWQAWFLPKKAKTPTSIGIFRGPSVAATIPNEVTAVGISEEPDGGSPKPTTPRAVARM